MSTLTRERLYNLLPALYRIRDAHRGEPLRALLAIIEGELQRLEHDIDGLYDDWFIETCDEWAVPYIGDLLGVRALHPVGNTGTYSHRSYVANTLAYRRRKGTAPVLEQLARDVTGWPARVVEFFQLLGTTQHMNHVRLANLRTPDLRNTNQLELLEGPFEQAAHTAEVRRIASHRGTYNIPNIGLFLWRLQSYAVTRSTARRADPLDNRRYTFHPLGYDTPLFNQPQTETEITRLAAEINVPGVLRRRPLYDELEARRQVLIAGETPEPLYFGNQPVLEVFMDPLSEPLLPEELVICNLGAWDAAGWQPPQSRTFSLPDGRTLQTRVAVDPVLGRLAILADVAPPDAPLEVSYAYGFSGDVGGGPYNRQDAVSAGLDREVTWHVGVSAGLAADDETQGLYTTLAAAISKWNQQPAHTVGVIALMDSRSYIHAPPENLPQIDIPRGSLLLIVAADWPEVEVADASGQTERQVGHVVPDGRHPHVHGDITVRGTTAGDSLDSGSLVLDGLRIEGRLNIEAGNLGALRVSHCTLVPRLGEVSLQLQRANKRLKLTMFRSIISLISITAVYACNKAVCSSMQIGTNNATSMRTGVIARATISLAHAVWQRQTMDSTSSGHPAIQIWRFLPGA